MPPVVKTELDAVDSFASVSPTLAALLAAVVEENEGRNSWAEGAATGRYIPELAERDLFSAEPEALLDNAEWLLSGTDTEWMRAWLQAAVLEAVQNIMSNERIRGDRRTRAEAVYELRGDRSKQVWRDLNAFWGKSLDQI